MAVLAAVVVVAVVISIYFLVHFLETALEVECMHSINEIMILVSAISVVAIVASL